MTWSYNNFIDTTERELLAARELDIASEWNKSDRKRVKFKDELDKFLSTLLTLTQSDHNYRLLRLGLEVEDFFNTVIKKRLSIETGLRGEVTKRVQSISDCMDFMKSAANLMNVYLNNEQPAYFENLNTARIRFNQTVVALEKNISPTLSERLKGIVSMILGSLITVCSFGFASPATAVKGYHLFFGEKNKLIHFKHSLLEKTQIKANFP